MKNILSLICFALISLTLLTGCGKESPSDVANKAFDAFMSGNIDEFMTYYKKIEDPKELKKGKDGLTFLYALIQTQVKKGEPFLMKVLDEKIDGDKAQVLVEFTNKKDTSSEIYPFIKENGKWVIFDLNSKKVGNSKTMAEALAYKEKK
jgi:hypothetical protein